jgi:hypothetical protein
MRMAFAAVLLLTTSALAGQFAEEDRQALQSYRLSEENIEKVMRVNERLAAEAKKNPSFVKQLAESARNDKTLGDSIERLGSNPTVKGSLAEAGISARDFVLTNVAGMQAAMVAGVRKTFGNGSEGAPSEADPDGVNPANLQFVESHPDLMQRWRESSAATARAGQSG